MNCQIFYTLLSPDNAHVITAVSVYTYVVTGITHIRQHVHRGTRCNKLERAKAADNDNNGTSTQQVVNSQHTGVVGYATSDQ